MIGSARVGERRLLRLVEEYGLDTTTAAVGEVLDSAERQTRQCIRAWKDGVFRGESVLDDDGHGARDVYIRATVTKRGDGLVVDLTDCHPQVVGFINSSYPNTMASVFMALAYLIDPRTPKNEGTFRPVSVKLRQGTVVWPYPPAPVTLCTNHCAQEIAEAVIKALAGSCPDRVLAGWSRRFRIAITGTNPRNGRPFIWHLFHARGGGGASAVGDGWETRPRQHGGRRHPPSVVRRAGRPGRPAPPLPHAGRGPDARTPHQGDGHPHPTSGGVPRGIGGRRRLRQAGSARSGRARRRPGKRLRHAERRPASPGGAPMSRRARATVTRPPRRGHEASA
jgi:hypothetical protein